jgi:hypothetical protein
MVSIDDYIRDRAPHDPASELGKRPDLVEQLQRGRAAGLSWEALTEWLGLHGIAMSRETLRKVGRGWR